MPFQSKAQQRFMFAEHPDIAKRWAAMTNFSKLPQRVSKKPTSRLAAKIAGRPAGRASRLQPSSPMSPGTLARKMHEPERSVRAPARRAHGK